MVYLSNDLKVSVSVAGDRAKEYDTTYVEKDGVETVTCFIEAIEGKDFSVSYRNTPFIKDCTTFTKLFVDGKKADSYTDCLTESGYTSTIELKGYSDKQTSTVATFRKFIFGPMRTTHEGSPKDIPEEILREVCSIRIAFEVKRRVGDIKHETAKDRQDKIPSSTSVHEDSKASLWGLSTRPGESITDKARGRCYCTVEDVILRKQVVIFNYRSHAFLVAQGHKEATIGDQRRTFASFGGEDDDDEVQIDTHRTERTASRRRAREERMPNIRNVRPKREGTVKIESIVKKEEDEPNQAPRITLDLTEDGEGYTVIQPKRETIVIDDDSQDEDD